MEATMKMVNQFLKHVVPGVIRPVRILWNEVIGFIFMVLAVFMGAATWRRTEHFSTDAGGVGVLVGSWLFVALLAWFGISSFLRARKIGKS